MIELCCDSRRRSGCFPWLSQRFSTTVQAAGAMGHLDTRILSSHPVSCLLECHIIMPRMIATYELQILAPIFKQPIICIHEAFCIKHCNLFESLWCNKVLAIIDTLVQTAASVNLSLSRSLHRQGSHSTRTACQAPASSWLCLPHMAKRSSGNMPFCLLSMPQRPLASSFVVF